MDKFFNLSDQLTEDKVISRQHRIYADTFYSDGLEFNPISTTSTAPQLKIKFFLDVVLYTDPNLEEGDIEKEKFYNVGKYFELDPGEVMALNNTHFPTVIEQPFDFMYECTANDGDGNFTWRLTPNKPEYTLYMSSIIFEDSYFNTDNGWFNPDNPENLIDKIELDAIDSVPLPYEYLRKYADALIVDGTESYPFDTTSLADYLRCRIFLDVVKQTIHPTAEELEENPDAEDTYKYYRIGRSFSLESGQQVQFNNTHFLELDDQRFSFTYTISKNTGNGQFVWRITIDKPDYELFFSNIVFEDSVYEPQEGWLEASNPENVINLLETDAIDSLPPLYRYYMDTMIIAADPPKSMTTKSRADYLKIKFFLDAVKYVDPDLAEDDELKTRYFRVGKYFELENGEVINLNNSHVFDPKKQSFTITFSCTKNVNGIFNWNLTINKAEYQLYISSVILQESLYDAVSGWLNINNPDNILEHIDAQSLDAIPLANGGGTGEGYPPDERTIIFTTDGKLMVPIDESTIIVDENGKLKSTIDGTQTVYTLSLGNDGATKEIYYPEGDFTIRLGFVAAGNLVFTAKFPNETDTSIRTIQASGVSVGYENFEANVEKTILANSQNNITTFFNVVDRVNFRAYEIQFSTIGYTDGSFPVSFAVTIEPFGPVDPADVSRFMRSGRILREGGAGYLPDGRTIILQANNSLSVPIDNKSIIVDIDGKIKVGKPGLLDYSLEEQDTGQKWIDGKAVYQKTVITLNMLSNAQVLTGVDTIVLPNATMTYTGNNEIYFGFVLTHTGDTMSFRLNPTTHVLFALPYLTYKTPPHVTFQYTKV